MAGSNKYITYGEALSIAGAVKGLYFAQGVGYNPASANYVVECTELDNTKSVSSITRTIQSSHNNIAVKLRNEIVQNKTVNNAWYPSAVCGKTYEQFNNGSIALPIYYQENITINPLMGKLKAKDFIIISGGTEVSLLEKLAPQPSAFTINTVNIVSAKLIVDNGTISFSNLSMTLSTSYNSCTWYFGTMTGSDSDITVLNTYSSVSSVTCGKNEAPILTFSGTVCGKSLSAYSSIHILEFSQNHFDVISPGNSYSEIGVTNGSFLPNSPSDVKIYFNESI